MFTTITKLRSSGAMQSRVTQVFNALKKRFGGKWDEGQPFPILFVLISNSVADHEWVMNASNVFVVPKGWNAAARDEWSKTLPENWGNQCTKAKAEEYLQSLATVVHGRGIKLDFFPTPASMMAPAELADMKARAGIVAKSVPAKQVPALKKDLKKLAVTAKAAVKTIKEVQFINSKTGITVKKSVPAVKVGNTSFPTMQSVGGKNTSSVLIRPGLTLMMPDKPLPIPSVLKMIRDLVKGHPKIMLVEEGNSLHITHSTTPHANP